MPKRKKGCQHDGDFYPLHGDKSLRQDPLVGWVVDVMCGKCLQTGIAAVDYKRIDWNEEKTDFNEMMGKLYGPFKHIWREEEAKLCAAGKFQHVLCITSEDVPYEDLPKEERPVAAELKERGETKEDYMGSMFFANVGHRLVNVEVIFESTKPMPEGLMFENFWFDEEHLKAP